MLVDMACNYFTLAPSLKLPLAVTKSKALCKIIAIQKIKIQGFLNNKDTQLSKTLSWLLRHGAVKEGLTISSEGYVSTTDILQHKTLRGKYNFTDIERVVNNNSKKRFKLRLNVEKNVHEIKANQGHTIKRIEDKELIPILEPKYDTVVHGTYLSNWNQIKVQGLSRMERKHIHCAKGTLFDPNVLSGLRKDAQVFIYIDLEKALTEGLKFYESENGVILTEGDEQGYLKPKYFLKVTKNTAVSMMDSPSRSPCPKKVHITGFPSYTQPQDLTKVFTQYGNVKVEKITKKFAVLAFSTEDEANDVIEDSGKVNIYGEFLTVKPFSGKIELNTPKREGRNREKGEHGTPKREFPKTKEKGGSIVEPNLINLSGDFYEQLDSVLSAVRLTQEEVTSLSSLYADLEVVLQQAWPGCVAIPFGSITTGLGVKTSDADCFIQVPGYYRHAGANYVNKAKRILLRYPDKFDEILAIPRANTPIVKFFHVPTATNCDVTFKTLLGAQNSKLIAFFLHADPRLIPLAVMIKYWAKVHGFSGTGKLTNYALTMLIIFYLQQPPVSILPSVEWLQRDPANDVIVDSWNTGFMHEIDKLPKSTNTSSISELLGGFFQYYSTFNFDEYLVCPFMGYALRKDIFKDYNLLPDEMKRYRQNIQRRLVGPLKFTRSICIQDPFELCHNVASAINSKVSSDIIAYFKFAATAYDDEKLNNCEGLLKTILLQKPKLPRGKNSPEFRTVIFPHYIHNITNPDWKSVVRDVTMSIFEDICKIKLTKVEEKPNPEAKKQKEKYTGVVTKAIWKRKQFSKLYNMMNITFTEKQRRITNEIMNVDKQTFNIQIQLTLTFSNEPKNAVASLKQLEADKEFETGNMYREFGKFFMSFMTGWFIVLLRPHLKKKENAEQSKEDNNVQNKESEVDLNVDVTVSDDASTSGSDDSKHKENNNTST